MAVSSVLPNPKPLKPYSPVYSISLIFKAFSYERENLCACLRPWWVKWILTLGLSFKIKSSDLSLL